MHLILCDAIDAGKSTFCEGLVRRLMADGVALFGWITPPHLVDGVKEGHDFVALRGDAMDEPIPFTRRYPFDGAVPWRRWHFSQAPFAIADTIPTRGFFLMDEIGPLELDAHRGFVAPMRRAFAEAPHTLTVLRKGLQDRLVTRYPQHAFRSHTLAQTAECEAEIRRALREATARRSASS